MRQKSRVRLSDGIRSADELKSTTDQSFGTFYSLFVWPTVLSNQGLIRLRGIFIINKLKNEMKFLNIFYFITFLSIHMGNLSVSVHMNIISDPDV